MHEYDFPFDRPPTTIGEPAPVAEPAAPPFDDTHATPKSVIPLPPSNGATNDTLICAFPADTVGLPGALGTVLGTTTTDAADGELVPFAFVAVTVHEYDFPFDRPPTTIGEPAPVAEPAAPPFDDTHAAVYPVIALPPSNGATNDTLICAFPADTVGCAGGSGTRLGITAADAADGELVPFAFVAVTVHEYDFPFDKPPTTIGEPAPVAEPAAPPFDDTHATPKSVIPLPPSNGATNDTLICAFPADTVGCAGGSGTRLGITAADAADGELVPFAFVAVTVHEYELPFDKPPTTIGEPAPVAEPAAPPFDDTHATPKSVIPLPPSNGATNDTLICAFPADTVGGAGALGTVLGTTTTDAADSRPVPFAFVAVTVHEYELPFDKPPTTIGEPAPGAEPAAPPFDDTHAAVYPVIALPPSNGATNDTAICASPADTVGCAGGSGTSAHAGVEATSPRTNDAVTSARIRQQGLCEQEERRGTRFY